MDEERMSFQRQKLYKESARFISSNSTQTNNSNNKKEKSDKKRIRCKYCYRVGHTDEECLDKKQKRPPSMPAWVTKTTCMNCKKKGHLAFNCPPKYACKVIRPKPQKSNNNNKKITANNVRDEPDQEPRIAEFAGMATSQLIHSRIILKQRNEQNGSNSQQRAPASATYYPQRRDWDNRNSFQYHKSKIHNITYHI